YTVVMLDVTPAAEMQRRRDDANAEMTRMRESHVAIDDSLIATYAAANNLNVQQTESGLNYAIERRGTGDRPEAGERVKVNYTLTNLQGDKIDSSYDRGEPFSFTLGRGEVIPGWDEGIALLKEGAKAKFLVPSRLAYNERALGPTAPPFSVLMFDVELIEVVE
ncbi:MAG: FKBP-type peptidyl-prolyl cis-trans isomerase, partial [Catalinimonas sp.]